MDPTVTHYWPPTKRTTSSEIIGVSFSILLSYNRRRKTNKKQLLNDELDSLTVTRKSVTELAENFFCSTVFS